jgi:hypothetical protein
VYEELKNARQAMKELYMSHFDEHVKKVANIVKMVYTTNRVRNVQVEYLEDLAKSLLQDDSADNVKKACFIVYYSWKSCYQRAFNQTLEGHYEKKVMEAMNVTYGNDEENPTSPGCVATFGLACTNDYQCKLRCRLKDKLSFRTMIPKGMDNRGKKSDYIFYIQRGARVDMDPWHKVRGSVKFFFRFI